MCPPGGLWGGEEGKAQGQGSPLSSSMPQPMEVLQLQGNSGKTCTTVGVEQRQPLNNAKEGKNHMQAASLGHLAVATSGHIRSCPPTRTHTSPDTHTGTHAHAPTRAHAPTCTHVPFAPHLHTYEHAHSHTHTHLQGRTRMPTHATRHTHAIKTDIGLREGICLPLLSNFIFSPKSLLLSAVARGSYPRRR